MIPISIDGVRHEGPFRPMLTGLCELTNWDVSAPSPIAFEQEHSVTARVRPPAYRPPLISGDLAAEVTCLVLSSVPSPSAVWQGCCGTAVRPGPEQHAGEPRHVQSRCRPRPLLAAGVTPAGRGLPCRQGALAMQCNHWLMTSVLAAWEPSTKLGEIPLRPLAGAHTRPLTPFSGPPAFSSAVGAQAHQAAGGDSQV